MIRWKAVGPLACFAALGLVAWWLFADRIARRTLETVGSAALGAKVEIRDVELRLARGRVAIRGLTVASPFEALENLLQADELVADLALAPLLEKKVVIDRLAAKGLRFGTPRATDGRIPGSSSGLMDRAKDFAGRLPVPALQLATGKIDIARLDPARLETPAAARALGARVDSVRQAWDEGLAGLDVSATVDSGVQMAERLRRAKGGPPDLKLLGDARRTLDRVKQTGTRLTALERTVRTGTTLLETGVAGLEDAKRRDYALGQTLLQLPSLDAADIGAALFGRAAVERFQRALYWAELGRRYMPPGLLPKVEAGPRRARRAGSTVRFPRAGAYPAFLLRSGELSFQLAGAGPGGGDRAEPRAYAAQVAGLTSDPALYGRPATLSASAPGVRAAALLDHVHATPRDTAAASLAGLTLPELTLPQLPVRLAPGRGSATLSFALAGDSIRARWSLRADGVRWARDTAQAATAPLGDVVWRAVSGIPSLEVSAGLAGTLARPRLTVSSNLDRVVAERIRALVGDEVVAAERKMRGRVDSIVERDAGPARAAARSVTADVPRRLAAERARLDGVRRTLEQRLKDLTRLPGIRLP